MVNGISNILLHKEEGSVQGLMRLVDELALTTATTGEMRIGRKSVIGAAPTLPHISLSKRSLKFSHR